MPDAAPLPESTLLQGGRYVVVGALGEGSQGTTWDAVDKREGRAVAIKRFDVRGARAWKDVELAEREARVLSSLSHPRLPRYLDHFEENGVLYLVMEKIEGTPLSVLKKRGPMREADVARLLGDADEVLTYLSGLTPAVVHRDLKPSNVIQRPDGSFAFVDFGAVRDRMRPEGGSTVVGTFGYMAPEQFQGRAGPGSDVYAMGATALALLTGEEPEKLPHRGLAIDVDAALGGRVSRSMRDALAQMLEPDPDRRPTRIAPLLAAMGARDEAHEWSRMADLGREMGREIRGKVEREIRDHVERATGHRERHATRQAEWQAKRAARRTRRAERAERTERTEQKNRRRHAKSTGAPWLVALVVGLALGVAQLAVLLSLRVVVPLVLVLLSLVFGSALRDAARGVGSAGGRAISAIGRARKYVDGGAPEGADGGPRVSAEDGPRRVAVAEHDDDALDDDEQNDDATERPARRRSGR